MAEQSCVPDPGSLMLPYSLGRALFLQEKSVLENNARSKPYDEAIINYELLEIPDFKSLSSHLFFINSFNI